MKTSGPQTKFLLEQKLKIVEDKIAKYDILKNHHEKVQALESQLQGVKEQQATLYTKYGTEPYKNSTVDKNLEGEYLTLRATELEL